MNELKKYFKCGIGEGQPQKKKKGLLPAIIITHHLSYNPEAIVNCCWSCHRKIHHKVRRENACPLSANETHRLSTKSSNKRITKTICFSETVALNVRLMETLQYNMIDGHIRWAAYFRAGGGKKLYFYQIQSGN